MSKSQMKRINIQKENDLPIVHFSHLVGEVVVGQPAWVYPIDHTSPLVSNRGICRTSTVQKVISEDEFFTLNSHYIKNS